MHRIATTPGGYNPLAEGVIVIEQTPAPIIFLTAADTDIQTLAGAVNHVPSNFPAVRVTNLLHLQQQFTIDDYAEKVLSESQLIVVRLLGGVSYFLYGLEVLKEIAEKYQIKLIIIPGDDRPDAELISHSNISLSIVNQVWQYFVEGGVENFKNCLLFLGDILGQADQVEYQTEYQYLPPTKVAKIGIYQPSNIANFTSRSTNINNQNINDQNTVGVIHELPLLTWDDQHNHELPKVGILFYRSHYLAGNTAPIDALCQALINLQIEPVPVFVTSPRDEEIQAELLQYFFPGISDDQIDPKQNIQLLINTTSFAVSVVKNQEVNLENQLFCHPLFQSKLKDLSEKNLSDHLNIPVLQVICSSSTVEQWESQLFGLLPRDLAMNVALPEMDGNIITQAISFKAVQTWHEQLETDVVSYIPQIDRVNFVANLAKNWLQLQQKLPREKKIALILANYPTRNGRLANGVGLDTPASCVKILAGLAEQGYLVNDLPASGDQLISILTKGITNDPETHHLHDINQSLSIEKYAEYFGNLPVNIQTKITARWGEYTQHNIFPVSGQQFGNIFVGIQPSRGYDLDPSLNYHAPDLEPTHQYLAFYFWLKYIWQADAIVHVGKHGNLEWLPGKSVALSNECFPEIALTEIPHFYPFIVNDPGEGSQAKRRSHAVIIDHLTPPLTRAELYGDLQQVENLIDEYYQAESLDPARLPVISDRLLKLIKTANLPTDFANLPGNQQRLKSTELTDWIAMTDGYLCELKEAQIRDGLHIFGTCPTGEQLRDLIIAIARYPSYQRLGFTRAIALDLNIDIDPLTVDFAELLEPPQIIAGKTYYNTGDLVEYLEKIAGDMIDDLLNNAGNLSKLGVNTQTEITWIANYLLPSLQQTEQEITNLLTGLAGYYVPAGPSGAPTRGRTDVLPTGRNFYAVDIRSVPTETAWQIGQLAADNLIERYTQENGEYPKTIGLSVWGTATMRTGGDDLAEALALIGAKPVWSGPERRVINFEILPLSILGRPRVDVTLRISGFFRDAFPHLINLFDQAAIAVSQLDEPADMNPLAQKVQEETAYWLTQGLEAKQAIRRSQYRIFGSKPGAYGAGLQGLIESQNWHNDADLATAYINWSSYAYSGEPEQLQVTGVNAPEAFSARLKQMQIVLHNQDNREHDLLDSDDYYQFQGGMIAAVRHLAGKNPQAYFGDHSMPAKPKIRQLSEQIARVYRSRVVNPKWIAGVMRHGYKGAFEMAATLDYLFAYDVTAHCVEDFMYEGIAESYIFDEKVQDFLQTKNPWALRDMSERLLEANQRGFWSDVPNNILDKLRAIALQAEADIEGKGL
jgi:cobaltochelatase CobN